jgi:hypothetical protein
MIFSALNYWTTCPRNHALTQLHTRRVLPGAPFWAPSKHLDISSGSLPHIIIMASRSPLSGKVYAHLGLTVGLFSLLVSSPAFAQDDQAEPGLPPPVYPFPHPTPPFASGNGQAEPGFPPSRSPPPGSYQVQSPGYTPSHDEGLLVMGNTWVDLTTTQAATYLNQARCQCATPVQILVQMAPASTSKLASLTTVGTEARLYVGTNCASLDANNVPTCPDSQILGEMNGIANLVPPARNLRRDAA